MTSFLKTKWQQFGKDHRERGLFERIDSLGQPVPAFNLQGYSSVNTSTGGLLTLVTSLIVLSYSLIKLLHLVEKHNPNVSEVYELDFYNYEEVISLDEINFEIAFSVEGYLTREMKNDPRYVKYLVRTYGIEDGKEFERILPYHKCTEEDWSQFQPPSKSAKDVIAEIKRNPKRGMYCLERDANVQIYGNEKDFFYQRLEIVIVPCNYVHTYLGYEGDSIHPECVADLQEQIDYLGPIDLMLYYTQDTLSARSFDDDAVMSSSIIKNTQVSEKSPNWVNTLVERNILSDETELVQLGSSVDREFYKLNVLKPQTSSWIEFPTPENPKTRYKFTSVEVNFSPHVKTIYRQTYSVLDWLGDVGGLFDAITLISRNLLIPISSFALQAQLLSQLFRYQKSENPSRTNTDSNPRSKNRGIEEEGHFVSDMKADFQILPRVGKLSYFRSCLTCQSKYKRMLKRSEQTVEKELDLRKFIHQQKVTMTALLGLLSGPQSFFVDKMSQLVIRESSGLEDSSSDGGGLSNQQKENFDYAQRLALSSNKTDQKLVSLYKLGKRRGQRTHLVDKNQQERADPAEMEKGAGQLMSFQQQIFPQSYNANFTREESNLGKSGWSFSSATGLYDNGTSFDGSIGVGKQATKRSPIVRIPQHRKPPQSRTSPQRNHLSNTVFRSNEKSHQDVNIYIHQQRELHVAHEDEKVPVPQRTSRNLDVFYGKFPKLHRGGKQKQLGRPQ